MPAPSTFPRFSLHRYPHTTPTFRDAKITLIYEGTNQIHRMVVARKTFTGVR